MMQQSVETILLDMDGVLWHGEKPVIAINELFDAIGSLGCQVFCVTNNSTRTIRYHQEKLAAYGVSLDPSHIITSAEATAAFIAEEFQQGGNIFVVGEEGIKQALIKKGFQLVEEKIGNEVLAVIVGLDQNLTYRDLELAVYYLHKGALFVGTNPDLTIPTPVGPAPGAGTIIKGIEVSSGVSPQIIGKPFSPLYSLALTRSNTIPGKTLMIGDRLETDIRGAQHLGMMTALVLSGISTRQQAEAWDPPPDIVAENALRVIDILRNHNG